MRERVYDFSCHCQFVIKKRRREKMLRLHVRYARESTACRLVAPKFICGIQLWWNTESSFFVAINGRFAFAFCLRMNQSICGKIYATRISGIRHQPKETHTPSILASSAFVFGPQWIYCTNKHSNDSPVVDASKENGKMESHSTYCSSISAVLSGQRLIQMNIQYSIVRRT